MTRSCWVTGMLAAAIAMPAIAYLLAGASVEDLPPLPLVEAGVVEPYGADGLRIGTVDVERVWGRYQRVAEWDGRIESSKRGALAAMDTIGDPQAKGRFVESEHERLESLVEQARQECVADICRVAETLGKIGGYDFVFDRSAVSEGEVEALLHAETEDLTELVLTCLNRGFARTR